jgi:hypothetical protein
MTEAAPAPRRFPPPWQVIEHPESFEVQGATGQALAFVYFEDEDGRRNAMKRLTSDEARRIASTSRGCPGCCSARTPGFSATFEYIATSRPKTKGRPRNL